MTRSHSTFLISIRIDRDLWSVACVARFNGERNAFVVLSGSLVFNGATVKRADCQVIKRSVAA